MQSSTVPHAAAAARDVRGDRDMEIPFILLPLKEARNTVNILHKSQLTLNTDWYH